MTNKEAFNHPNNPKNQPFNVTPKKNQSKEKAKWQQRTT